METFPKDMVFLYGQHVALNCSSKGGPDNIFIWFYNGTIVSTQTLIIGYVTMLNAIEYVCVVHNPAGYDTDSTHVYLEPRFISEPVDVSARISETVNMTCVVQGNPVPDITWEYNGEIFENETLYLGPGSGDGPSGISPGSYISFFETLTFDNGVAKLGTLVLNNVTYSDYGQYKCTASSTVGEENFSISSNITLTGE